MNRTCGPNDPRPVHVLLLLADRVQLDQIDGLLRQRLGQVKVTQAADLEAAMMSVAGPMLAVLDPDLCDALELEFAEHLLRVNPDTIVLVLSDERLPSGRPAQARLLHAPRTGLVHAVDQALSRAPSARARIGLAGSAA